MPSSSSADNVEWVSFFFANTRLRYKSSENQRRTQNRTKKKMSNHKFAPRQKLSKWKVVVAASCDAETFSVPTVHEWWKWIKWTNNVICERIGTGPNNREKITITNVYNVIVCHRRTSFGWMHVLACDVIVCGANREDHVLAGMAWHVANKKLSALFHCMHGVPLTIVFSKHILLKEQMLNFNATNAIVRSCREMVVECRQGERVKRESERERERAITRFGFRIMLHIPLVRSFGFDGISVYVRAWVYALAPTPEFATRPAACRWICVEVVTANGIRGKMTKTTTTGGCVYGI